MEVETPFKEGFLLFPPHGILVKKKSWHKKYCKLFKSSRHGIERIEIFETEEEAWKNKSTTILTLENCVKISPNPQKHQSNVFTVVTKSGNQDFATLFEQEMLEWIAAFQTVAFKDDSSTHTIEEIEEDNDLYCSSGEGVFVVKVIPTPTSIRCGLGDFNYTLVVTQNALQLRAPLPNERVLFTWPFMYIRRYGYRGGHITFEAGRKCDSGEGVFQLENSQMQEVFRCISSSMKLWRQVVRKDEPSTPPPVPGMINCGDGQLQAALSMEPGSRTPLPPSPTSTSARFVEELTNSLENSHLTKQKPAKPPRKGLKTTLSEDIIDPGLLKVLKPGYENVTNSCGSGGGSYDSIEFRKEAWKTLGVNELTHTEKSFLSDEEELPKLQNSDEAIHTSRKIINQPCVDENYDKLQHFGGVQPASTRPGAKSQYRQITPQITTPTTPQASNDVSWNEYDVIQENLQESFRPADDSHLGYGMIRKNLPPPIPPEKNEPNLDMEYAVVVKPKKA